MSFLLDALNKNQNPAYAGQSEQLQSLQFYRKVTWALLALILLLVVTVGGYFAGKWLQQRPSAQAPLEQVAAATPKEQAQVTEQEPATTPATDDNQVSEATSSTPSAPVQGVVNMQAVQQANPYQHYQQPMMPVYVMPQGYQQGAVMQWVPAYPNPYMGQMQQPQMQNYSAYNANQPNYNNGYQQNWQQGQGRALNNPGQNNTYNTDNYNNQNYGDDYTNQGAGYGNEPQIDYSSNDLAGVSDELKRKFADAVAATQNSDNEDTVTTASRASSLAEPIELLPDAIQSRIPKLVYQAHIYATEQSKRWIKMNGYELYEGDTIGRMRVVEITPEQSILSIDGYEFSLQAMQDWP